MLEPFLLSHIKYWLLNFCTRHICSSQKCLWFSVLVGTDFFSVRSIYLFFLFLPFGTDSGFIKLKRSSL